jgi:hypothetical protein
VKSPAALFPIALALGGIILVPWLSARAQDTQVGPIEIDKCQTIDQPGSYKLVNNLTFTGNTTCLFITASNVTIDLAGFTISGPGSAAPTRNAATAIGTANLDVAVRNGSIVGFNAGVVLHRSPPFETAAGSIVEGLRISGCPCSVGISATGIVKGNTVETIGVAGEQSMGISANGIITGNFVTSAPPSTGYEIGQGSTVIGNTAAGAAMTVGGVGISVSCPSNVINNTAVNNSQNLVLNGDGCNNTNNVAP